MYYAFGVLCALVVCAPLLTYFYVSIRQAPEKIDIAFSIVVTLLVFLFYTLLWPMALVLMMIAAIIWIITEAIYALLNSRKN